MCVFRIERKIATISLESRDVAGRGERGEEHFLSDLISCLVSLSNQHSYLCLAILNTVFLLPPSLSPYLSQLAGSQVEVVAT